MRRQVARDDGRRTGGMGVREAGEVNCVTESETSPMCRRSLTPEFVTKIEMALSQV